MIVKETLWILPQLITFLSDFIASAAFLKWESQSGYSLSENNKQWFWMYGKLKM